MFDSCRGHSNPGVGRRSRLARASDHQPTRLHADAADDAPESRSNDGHIARRAGRALSAHAPVDPHLGALPRRRPPHACRAMSCWRSGRGLDARDHDRRSGRSGLALACADGPVPAWRRLHSRLDREPARPRHAQRRPRLPEFQHPEVGDTIGLGSSRMRIERVNTVTCSPGAPRTATGSGRSCWKRPEARPG
jgi:hypothetical protein